jgi:hypothetical protein
MAGSDHVVLDTKSKYQKLVLLVFGSSENDFFHKSGISVRILVSSINYFPVELDAYSPITNI